MKLWRKVVTSFLAAALLVSLSAGVVMAGILMSLVSLLGLHIFGL